MNNLAQIRHYELMYGPFTHMGPGDKAIWATYLESGGKQFAPFTYDLRVGNGVELGDNTDGLSRRVVAALTRKRIDVVYSHENIPVIVEVKQRAGLSAIGQLIGYRQLYRLDYPNRPDPKLLLVTDVLQPDMIPTLNEFGISYYEVQPWTST